MKKTKRTLLLTVILLIAIFMQSNYVLASDIPMNISKIDAQLLAAMENETPGQLHRVYIHLYDDPVLEQVYDEMPEATGFDPAVYENDNRFQAEIVPQITNEIVAQYGPVKAYETQTITIPAEEMQMSLYNTDNFIRTGNDYVYKTDSLITDAIKEEIVQYDKAWRQTSSNVFTRENAEFLESVNHYSSEEPEYVSPYTGSIRWSLTSESIKKLSNHPKVEQIGLFVEYEIVPCLSSRLNDCNIPWVRANYYSGSSKYDIGILEPKGKPDMTQINLTGTHVVMVGDSQNEPVSPHATAVTTVLAGATRTVNGSSYTGVVPNNRIYYAAGNRVGDLFTDRLNALIGVGCKIINLSFMIGTPNPNDPDDTEPINSYQAAYDGELDRLSNTQRVLFIIAAGNEGDDSGYISTPAYAHCAVTVANYDNSDSIPGIHSSSSYIAAYKPDIAAPGVLLIPDITRPNQVDTHRGTSYSAPVVAGVAEMIMQAGDTVNKTQPHYVKSVLLTSANWTKIPASLQERPLFDDTIGGGSTYAANAYASVQDYLRDRSGAGLVDAYMGIAIAHTDNYALMEANQNSATKTVYLSAGQKIRVASAVELQGSTTLSYTLSLEYNGSPKIERWNSHAQNIFEYTVPSNASGYYTIRLKDNNNTSNRGAFSYWIS